MKKFIFVLLALLLTVSLFACGNQTDNTEMVAYQFYTEGSDGGNAAVATGATAESASLLQIGTFSIVQTTDYSEKTEKTFTIGGNEFKGILTSRQQTSLATSKNSALHAYGVYDLYQVLDQDGNLEAEIHVNPNTGNITFFSDTKNRDNNGSFTSEQAIEKATEWMKNTYGNTALAGYTASTEEYTSITGAPLIVVTLQKQINGYNTSSWIQFRYNTAGDVVAINLKNYGVLESVISDIDAEQIEDAKNALLQILPSEYSVQENATELVLEANSGKCYLKLTAFNGQNGGNYYVNIE